MLLLLHLNGLNLYLEPEVRVGGYYPFVDTERKQKEDWILDEIKELLKETKAIPEKQRKKVEIRVKKVEKRVNLALQLDSLKTFENRLNSIAITIEGIRKSITKQLTQSNTDKLLNKRKRIKRALAFLLLE